MQFPAKITSSYHTCMLIKLFYIGMPVVRTEGRFARSLGRAVNGHVITNLALRLRKGASRARGAPLIVVRTK